MKRHKGCDKKTVKKEWIENLVIDEIKKIIEDDSLLEEIADSALEALSAENNALPLLRKQYAQVQKSIDNLLNAMEQGIITSSTKERMEVLEQQKSELSMQILREEAAKPTLTKKEILFWFHRFRKLDTRKLEHRRRLIDSFINAVFLYDDRIAFAFNYKDSTKTITLEEIENSALGSDLTSHAAPFKERISKRVSSVCFIQAKCA